MPTRPLAAASTGPTIPSGAIPPATSQARLSSKNMPPNEPMPLHQNEASPLLKLARRHGEVEGAVDEVRAAKPGIEVPVAHAQQRHRGQMAAGRLAADRQRIVAELPMSALHEPQGGGLAIVGTRRVRVLRSQAVFDRD